MNSKINKITYLIIIIVVIGAIVAAYFNSSSPPQKLVGSEVQQSTLAAMKAIAMNSTLADEINLGSAGNLPLDTNGTMIYTNSLPTVIYYGADYCPFCAATRWSLILALMRFGNFTLLHYMQSSPSDYSPNTPTFSFYNSSYSSNFIYFMSVETLTRNKSFLQAPNKLENATFSKYNLNNKSIPANERGGIPFIDFGNKSIQIGAEFTPTLIGKMSWSQIIQALKNPNSKVSQAIIGNANIFTAQICKIDNYSPKKICNQTYVKKILQSTT